MKTHNEEVYPVSELLNHEGENKQPVTSNSTDFVCSECDSSHPSQSDLEVHMIDLHKKSCHECDYVTAEALFLQKNIQIHHRELNVNINNEDQKVFSCDECDFKCSLNIKLIKHVETKHSTLKYNCENCSFRSDLISTLGEHMIIKHSDIFSTLANITHENIVLKMIAELNANTLKEIENLKKDTKNAFLQLAQAIEKSLGKVNESFREDIETVHMKVESISSKIEKSISSFSDKVSQQSSTNSEGVLNCLDLDAHSNSHKRTFHKPSSPNTTYVATSFSPPPVKPKSAFNSRTKVLFVRDSVANIASARRLEEISRCRVRTVKAHTTIHRKENKSSLNFNKVTDSALNNPSREPYEALILAAPTEDITGLDTRRISERSNIRWFED